MVPSKQPSMLSPYQRRGLVPSFGYAPNLLEQDFTAKSSNKKRVVDLSYIATIRGWIYLAVVMNLYSRRIVGCHMSYRMKQGLATQALKMATALRCPEPGLIHHSDRGSQYVATDYQMTLK